LFSLVEPHYSKGETGRKPVGLAIMLRVYLLQQWFALADPGVENALYDSSVLRRFAGIDLGRAPAPDETTTLNFRHLLAEHALCGQMLDAVNHYLESRVLTRPSQNQVSPHPANRIQTPSSCIINSSHSAVCAANWLRKSSVRALSRAVSAAET
jgi:hypothetical protein